MLISPLIFIFSAYSVGNLYPYLSYSVGNPNGFLLLPVLLSRQPVSFYPRVPVLLSRHIYYIYSHRVRLFYLPNLAVPSPASAQVVIPGQFFHPSAKRYTFGFFL